MPALTLVSLLERYQVLETAMPRAWRHQENDRLHIYSLWQRTLFMNEPMVNMFLVCLIIESPTFLQLFCSW
jgi:hypothetical protein